MAELTHPPLADPHDELAAVAMLNTWALYIAERGLIASESLTERVEVTEVTEAKRAAAGTRLGETLRALAQEVAERHELPDADAYAVGVVQSLYTGAKGYGEGTPTLGDFRRIVGSLGAKVLRP